MELIIFCCLAAAKRKIRLKAEILLQIKYCWIIRRLS